MIGIFGGSFDPIHSGHLLLVLEVRKTIKMNYVYFVPLKVLPDRGLLIASDKQRVAMLRHALYPYPSLYIDECELKRSGFSYSIKTVVEYREKYPDTPIALIMGLDVFRSLYCWQAWDTILSYVHIIVVNRKGVRDFKRHSVMDAYLKEYQLYQPADLKRQLCGGILLLELALPKLSSTDVRAQIRLGKKLDGLVPKQVEAYINRHQLYRA